ELVLDLAAFNGMAMENMTRGRGWMFLDFGRRLERGSSVLRLLRAAVSLSKPDPSILESILEIADTSMTYRRRYFAAPQLPGVLEMLLRDETNPRSLAFQVKLLSEHSRALIPGREPAPEGEQTRVNALARDLFTIDLNALVDQHDQGTSQPILDLLDRWTA